MSVYSAQEKAMFNARMYDLLVGFKEGNEDCYRFLIRKFAALINQESYNSYIGSLDEDLRAEIYLTLFFRFRRFVIPDSEKLSVMIAASQE